MNIERISRTDLREDSVIELTIGVDMLNTLVSEHFGCPKPPEDWESGYTYECISRKILAVQEIINNALDVLSLETNGSAGEYFDAKVKFMASLLSEGENSH